MSFARDLVYALKNDYLCGVVQPLVTFVRIYAMGIINDSKCRCLMGFLDFLFHVRKKQVLVGELPAPITNLHCTFVFKYTCLI